MPRSGTSNYPSSFMGILEKPYNTLLKKELTAQNGRKTQSRFVQQLGAKNVKRRLAETTRRTA
jgi:hypothetical protein